MCKNLEYRGACICKGYVSGVPVDTENHILKKVVFGALLCSECVQRLALVVSRADLMPAETMCIHLQPLQASKCPWEAKKLYHIKYGSYIFI